MDFDTFPPPVPATAKVEYEGTLKDLFHLIAALVDAEFGGFDTRFKLVLYKPDPPPVTSTRR